MLSTWPPKLGGTCVRTIMDAHPLMLVGEPCTFDIMEEFSSIPSLGNDIWKKFELLPTPPRSPDRSEKGCCEDIFDDGGGIVISGDEIFPDIKFEHDDLIDELLREDFDFPSGEPFFESVWTPEVSDVRSCSELLHDCMWSGECTGDCKQKLARERHQSQAVESPMTPSPLETPAATPPPETSTTLTSPVVLQDVLPAVVFDEEEVAEEQCVDPSSVFTYTPLSDHCYHQAGDSAVSAATAAPKQQVATPIMLVRSRGVWKREYVVSDTPSESDDDDDDEEEEDEEIDVVTVAGERQQQHYTQLRTGGRGPRVQVSAAAPLPRMTSSGRVVNPTVKQENMQPTSRRKRSGNCGPKRRRARHVVVPPPKKARRVDVLPEVHRPRLVHVGMGSRSSSDSEDFERRREHNSMERKRRDDLRSAFQQLRAIVPELQENTKAPKVAILSQAAAHARQLTAQHNQIERTLRQELQRQRMLQRKLAQLQRSLRARS